MELVLSISQQSGICEHAVSEGPVKCAGIALTVALLIIGDEILAGKVGDTNSSFLCKELYAIGWRVAKARLFTDFASLSMWLSSTIS